MNSNLGHSVSSVSSTSCLEKPQLHRIGFTLVDWEGVRLHFDFELNDRAVIGLRATLWSGVGRLWLDLVGFWQETPGLSSLQEFISWSLSMLCSAAKLLGMNACMNVCSGRWNYAMFEPGHYAYNLCTVLLCTVLLVTSSPLPPLCSPSTVWWHVHEERDTYMSIFRLGSLTR